MFGKPRQRVSIEDMNAAIARRAAKHCGMILIPA